MAKNPELKRLEELLTRNRDVEEMLKIGIRDARPIEWTRGQLQVNFGINLTVHEAMTFVRKWRSRRASPAPQISMADESGAPVAEPVYAELMNPGEGLIDDIRAWGLERVRELLAAAKADPDCDATKIMEIMLVHASVSSQLKLQEADIMKLYAAQSRIAELERKNMKLDIDRYNAEVRAKDAETRRMGIEIKYSQVSREVEEARAAIAQGRPFDQGEVVDRISAALGLTGPLERRVEV